MAVNALNFGSKVVFLNGFAVTLPIAASNPASAVAGDFYYNSTSNTIYYYNGSAWVQLATGGTALTSVSVASANGLAGTSSGGTTPTLTLSTTITGILQGNGTAISAATTTGTGSVVLATSPTLITPALGTPSALVGTNITGTASGLTAGTVTTNANLTGDVTSVGNATTLATVNSNVGSFGSSTSIPSLTVNAKGLITAVSSNVVIAPAGTLSGTVLNSSVVTSSLTSLGIQAQALNMGSNQINNLATPSVSSDAATKGYVDSLVSGLTWQGPAKAYADSNIPLTGGATLTIDGYSVQNGDLVILGNQTIASQNGEYTASGIGTAYTLTPNGLPSAAGDAWLILDGAVYGDSAFVANAAVPAATFTEFAGPTAYTFNAPLSLSGRSISITEATTSTNGYLSSTDWNTFNNKQPAGSYITALTGDATASGPGSAVLTLATVNSNVGSFGSSTAIPSFTVNAKGLITAASTSVVTAPAGTLTGTTLAANVVSSSLTSVGTITSGTWTGTTIAIANGGTGQTSASAAFNALSPITTTGDMIYSTSGATNSRLPIGSTNQVLTVIAGVPTWASPATSGTVTSVSVVSANGFNGSVATATSTPAITISTTVNSPVLAGNGTAISAATTTGTGSTVVLNASPTLTGTLTAAAANFSGVIGANGGITSTGTLLINVNGGASALQIEALNFQRSTNGTNFVTETYVDSTTLIDNSGPTAVAAFQFAVSVFSGIEITYVIESADGAADRRVGTIRVTANSIGTITPSISDMYTESADCGVTWSATNSGGTISVNYTTSNQGAARTMRADAKFFRA
jgi:hypothetical protein